MDRFTNLGRYLLWFLLSLNSLLWASQSNPNELSGGIIVNPDGAFLRYARRLWRKDNFSAWAFDSFLVLSNEIGLSAEYRTDPSWLVTSLQVGVEPGFYLHSGQPTRQFDFRKFVRSKTEITIEEKWFRVYSRTTLLYRQRNFLEDDRFQRILIDNELAIEEALAPMVLLDRSHQESFVGSYWAYVEYTVGVIRGVGTFTNRISSGVVAENWPFDRVTINLDLFFSFTPGATHGLGSFLLFWWGW